MREIRETQENIIRYITDTQMITADTIGETKFAQLLLTRMAALEEQMRILAKMDYLLMETLLQAKLS